MKELVEVIAKSLVENPDEVVVTETEKDDAVVIELKVGPSDMGKVIGRQGRIAKAIRTVVKAASSKSSKKVIVDILQARYNGAGAVETWLLFLHWKSVTAIKKNWLSIIQLCRGVLNGRFIKGWSNYNHSWRKRGSEGISYH